MNESSNKKELKNDEIFSTLNANENSNYDICISNIKLTEFIHDLKEAIQSGQLYSCLSSKIDEKFIQQSNLESLSNQTFSFIINWLKKNKLPNEDKIHIGINEIRNLATHHVQSEMKELNEINCLKNKLKQIETEKNNLLVKINELNEENNDLKIKILSFKKNENHQISSLNESNEHEKLKKLIKDLVKTNDEKDRKIDELTKQVIRFKRIQEIVLSSQVSNLCNQKTFSYIKNCDELNFENRIDYSNMITKNINESELDTNYDKTHQKSNQNITQIMKNVSTSNNNTPQLINSISLSSSLSSSSSTTSNSSGFLPNNANSNLTHSCLQAPLATISEFTNCSSSSATLVNLKPEAQSSESLIPSNLGNLKTEMNNNNSKFNKAAPKSCKYSSATSLAKENRIFGSPSKLTNSSNKSIRQFFGKLIRTSLVNISDSNDFNQSNNDNSFSDKNFSLNSNITNSNFVRGGFRSTANARLQSNNSLDTLTFSKLNTNQVCEYLNKNGFEAYFLPNSDGVYTNKWIKNGLHLLQANQQDYERELGIKNPFHRKKLSLLLQSLLNNSAFLSSDMQNLDKLDQYWVLKWLDDIGLPQYKDVFNECMIDGRMLMHINNEDFQNLNINNELHYLSIKRAIHVLRLNNFDPQCLRRRPSGDDELDKSEIMLWTNHRVMEWLRSIDLCEYAPNLRGSGIHGGLMIFEARFNSIVLADILSIPSSKTLLRRHLSTLFNDLIGPQILETKKSAELKIGYQQLSSASKVKLVKKSSIDVGNFFSSMHKRTKSHDSKDFLSFLPKSLVNKDIIYSDNDNSKKSDQMCLQSATLPNKSTNNYLETNEKNDKVKLPLLSHENMPSSVV